MDFVKLLVNYNDSLFTGEFSGRTEPGATVRLLGTSTTVTAASDGTFTFEAIPGLNAVRCSKAGYVEGYEFGIVLSSETAWAPNVRLGAGTGAPDIDFSQFGSTDAWANASQWATEELQRADELGLIPDVLQGADLTQRITRAEFAAVCVKVYESLSGTAALPNTVNPFTDTKDVEVLKAYNLGVTNGTGDGSTFSPNELLNREQAASMLARVFKRSTMNGWTLAADGQFPLTYEKPAAFADDAQISAWAKDSVYFMAANGIIQGNSGKFMPKAATEAEEASGYAQATREQALIIAVRMVEKLG